MRPARPSFPSSKKLFISPSAAATYNFFLLPSSPLSLKSRLAADCPNLGPPVVQLVAASSLFLARLVFHEGGSSSNSIPHHVPNLGGVASRGLLESTTFFPGCWQQPPLVIFPGAGGNQPIYVPTHLAVHLPTGPSPLSAATTRLLRQAIVCPHLLINAILPQLIFSVLACPSHSSV